jgi:hypothetical protein
VIAHSRQNKKPPSGGFFWKKILELPGIIFEKVKQVAQLSLKQLNHRRSRAGGNPATFDDECASVVRAPQIR